MRAWRAGFVAGLALGAAAPAPAADRLAIGHDRVECVPPDRYTRIAATAAPADGVASALLQFRAAADGGWYSVAMAAEGKEWSAFLPRPVHPLARLEYRIVMRGSDAGEAATPPIAVRVGAECALAPRSASAVEAPIVVRVPKGAPLVPPVPAGFSPAGVVAAEDPVRKSRIRTLALAGGLAAGIAGVVLGGAALSDSPEFDVEVPAITLTRTSPLPGSVLSVSRDQLAVFLLLTGTGRTFNFTWRFEMLGTGRDAVCLFMNGAASARGQSATVTLVGRLTRTGACAERFDVDRSRLVILVGPRTVYQAVQPLSFHIEP